MVCLLPGEQIALISKEELVVTHLHIHLFSLSDFYISQTIWHLFKDKLLMHSLRQNMFTAERHYKHLCFLV